MALRSSGHPVEAIAPMGAIYLSARFALIGRTTRSGLSLATNEDIRLYLLQEAGLAIVPFQAFGATTNEGWFRLSVGAVGIDDVKSMLPRLQSALDHLR
jgi:aspartate aminotransferase